LRRLKSLREELFTQRRIGVRSSQPEDQAVNLSNQSLLVILVVGLIGAFIGDWLLPQLGIHLGVGMVALIINAFIGAVVLLLILRLVSGGGWGYRARWGSRW